MSNTRTKVRRFILTCTSAQACASDQSSLSAWRNFASLAIRMYLVKILIRPHDFADRSIATDKRGNPHNIFLISQRKHMLWVLIRSASASFLFLNENICCGYSLEAPRRGASNSLEAPRRGASNEYPQHMFSSRNKKDISIFWMKKAPYLLLCRSEFLLGAHVRRPVFWRCVLNTALGRFWRRTAKTE